PTTITFSCPPYDGKPRLGTARGEGKILEIGNDRKLDGLDGFNRPPFAEGVMEFLLRNPPRPLSSWLLVAEAKQETTAAGFQDFRQACDVLLPVFVGKNVKEAAISYIVKALAPVRECRGIFDQKGDRLAALRCLLFGSPDRFFQKINAGDL